MHSYCENCEQSRKELNDIKAKLGEFQNISKKIIKTDLLLQKYAELEKELSSLKTEFASKQKEFNQLNEQHQKLSKELESTKKQNKNLIEKKNETENSTKEIKLLLEETKSREKSSNEQIKTLSKQNIELQEEVATYYKKLETANLNLKDSNEKYNRITNEFENFKISINKSKTEDTSVKNEPRELKQQITETKSPKKKDETFFLFSDEEESDQESKIEIVEETITKIDTPKIEINEDTNLESEPNEDAELVKVSDLNFSDSCSLSDEETGSDSSLSSSTSSNSLDSSKISLSKCMVDNPVPFDLSEDSEESSEDEDSKEEIAKQKEIEHLKQIEQDKKQKELENSKRLEETKQKEIEQANRLEEETKQKELAEAKHLEEERKEKELDLKLIQIVDDITSKQTEEALTNLINQVVTETNICDFIIEKLINEEIKRDTPILASMALKEEAEELKLKEKLVREEIKSKLELEFIERIINEVTDSLMKECCERTLHQEKTERNMQIFDDILEELLPKMIEKELFSVIFEEMNCAKKMITPPREPAIASKSVAKQIKQSPQESKSKRLKLEHEFEHKTPTKDVPQQTRPQTEPAHFDNHHAKTYKEIRHNIKECLSEYFRKYNFRTGFSFADLDLIVEKIVKANTVDIEKAKFLADLLIIHFTNNRFIPLDDVKINSQTVYEENLFKEHQLLIEKKETLSDPQEIANAEKTLKQKKAILDKLLNVKITTEEDKYVYLIKKLKEHSNYETIFDEVLLELKVMILSDDFNKSYILRIGRMLCFLCKSSKNYQFLNCFIFDCLSLKNSIMSTYFHTFILSIMRVWPESLIYKESEIIQNPILCVIMYIVRTNIVKSTTNEATSNYSLYIMETLCNWKQQFEDCLQIWDYFQNVISIDGYVQDDDIFIIDDNDFKLLPLMFEYIQSFKLMCLNEGWEWTLNTFLKNLINKSLEENTEASSSESLPEDQKSKALKLLAFYLLSQASVLSHMFAKKDAHSAAIDMIKSYGVNLCKILFQPNHLNTKESFIVECAILESLLFLSPFSPTESFLQIQMWFVKYQSKRTSSDNFILPTSLEKRIRETYQFFKHKLPSHIVINF